MRPDAAALYQVVDATWPAAACHRLGPWLLREGRGGGKRVSAATALGPVEEADIAAAESGMAALGQPPLFMIRQGDAALDALLAGRGYGIIDPVVLYLAPLAGLADQPPGDIVVPLWPPLAATCAIWAEGGIGPDRVAVMERAAGPKISLLGRRADRAAGAGFVALAGKVAMLHALEVRPALRRQGTAVNMLRAAAIWAQDQGADWLSLAVTEANAGARNLYASLGMESVGHYHYRQK